MPPTLLIPLPLPESPRSQRGRGQWRSRRDRLPHLRQGDDEDDATDSRTPVGGDGDDNAADSSTLVGKTRVTLHLPPGPLPLTRPLFRSLRTHVRRPKALAVAAP